MIPRDLLYWLAGALDLGGVDSLERAGEAGAESIRKHARLALTHTPGDSFAVSVYALAGQPVALDRIVRAHLLNVTDKMPAAPATEPPKPVSASDFAELIEAARKAAKEARYPSAPPHPFMPVPSGWPGPTLIC